ncbi:hypothetical protein D3C78_1372120 [compost metagenome]
MLRFYTDPIILQHHVQLISLRIHLHCNAALSIPESMKKNIFEQRLKHHARHETILQPGLHLQIEGKCIIIAISLYFNKMICDIKLLL